MKTRRTKAAKTAKSVANQAETSIKGVASAVAGLARKATRAIKETVMAKTNRRGKSGGGDGAGPKTGGKSSRTRRPAQQSETGVRVTAAGNRRGGDTSLERASAKRPRTGSQSNAGAKAKKAASRPVKASARPALTAKAKPSVKTRTQVAQAQSGGEENTGTNHRRGRHIPNPKTADRQ